MKTFWPKVISNVDLHTATETPTAMDWTCFEERKMAPGYCLRSNHLEEESEGDRKIHAWRKIVERERNQFGWTCWGGGGGKYTSGEE